VFVDRDEFMGAEGPDREYAYRIVDVSLMEFVGEGAQLKKPIQK